jgi:carboxymethylenebutenolidase
MTELLKITSKDHHKFNAYFCEAQGKAKGNLLVLHEIFGLTSFIKDICYYWAAHGYHVLAPSLYDRLEENIAIPYNAEGYEKALRTKQELSAKISLEGKTGFDLQLIDIEAAKKNLITRHKLPIAILGLSFGGTLGWLSACRLENIAGVIAYYGTHIYQFVNEKPKCPVILHCAEYDELLTLQQAQEIAVKHPNIKVCMYPATHGFRCSAMENFAGQKFDKVASATADLRTKNFIDTCFNAY